MTNPKRVARAVDNVSLTADLIRTRIPRTETALHVLMPSHSGTERVTGGDISKPVESAVMTREAMWDKTWADAHEALMEAHRALKRASTILGNRIAEEQEGKPEERSEMADCRACERTVALTSVDRIRSGYCSACYRAWLRLGQLDRPAFERTRRGIDIQPLRASINISGVDHQLTEEQAERLGPNPTPETIAALKQEILR